MARKKCPTCYGKKNLTEGYGASRTEMTCETCGGRGYVETRGRSTSNPAGGESTGTSGRDVPTGVWFGLVAAVGTYVYAVQNFEFSEQWQPFAVSAAVGLAGGYLWRVFVLIAVIGLAVALLRGSMGST